MERKSDAVRRLVACGEYKDALRIASNFTRGISPKDRDVMKRGYECWIHPAFYQSIKTDTAKSIKQAIQTVSRLYGQTTQEGEILNSTGNT